MTKMEALDIVKRELYKDNLPNVEVQKALDYLKIFSISVTSEELANIRKNILKEFVDWYKNVLEQDFDDKAKIMNKQEDDIENWWFLNGQCTAIDRLITLLDRDLE